MEKVKSVFDSFPSLFSIKRDAIDKYPFWRDEQRNEYYYYISDRILKEFLAWEKGAIPYLKSCENKAQQYDELTRTKTINCAEDLQDDPDGEN